MHLTSSIVVFLAFLWPAESNNGAKLRIFVFDRHINKTVDSCYAEPANFGPTQKFGSFNALPVSAEPITGCTAMRPPPSVRNDSMRWAALINRDPSGPYACYFDHKALNAQAAGFGVAIIINYEENLSDMDSADQGSRVNIPVAMVTESCGYILRQYAGHGDRFYLKFWLAYPLDFKAYVIPFITIVTVCFLFFTSLWVAKWYRDYKRRQRNRLTRSSLKKLKQKKFDKATDPYECCAICLEDFAQGDKLRILPCNHAYHQVCVDPWLLKSRSVCPVCKRRVFPRIPGGSSESDSDEGAAASSANDERAPLLGSESGGGGGGTFNAAGPTSSGVLISVQASVHPVDRESPQPQPRESLAQRGGNWLV